MLRPTKEILLAETPSVGWTATWMENEKKVCTTGKHWPTDVDALLAINKVIDNRDYYGYPLNNV